MHNLRVRFRDVRPAAPVCLCGMAQWSKTWAASWAKLLETQACGETVGASRIDFITFKEEAPDDMLSLPVDVAVSVCPAHSQP
ncbi:hypothetical protein MUG91_G110n171 [Manis pentadactyla]|nr:hypothetical protein MUG91_G110n171 [Manis pentadactyla]